MMSATDGGVRLESALIAHETDLARYFYRRLHADAAADAYGEFLLTLWKIRRKTPTDPAEARLWLYGVARTSLHNVRRSSARRRAAGDRAAAETLVAATPTDVDSILDVRAAVAALAPEDAELVRLIYWDALTSQEAAQVLGINASTARSRLAAAKNRLRATLDPLEASAPGETLAPARSLP